METWKIELVKANGTPEILYDELVSEKICAKYTLNAQIAILRKAQSGLNVDEFEEFNAFAEQCKAEAREELGIE